MGNAKQTLFVPAGVYEVSSDLTIPSNIALEVYQGAIIQIDPGVALHIQGPFMAGPYQIFQDNSGDLTKGVKFARTCALLFVSPEWWGAVGDGKTDCALAINQAINSADLVPNSTDYHRIPVQFAAGNYLCASTINLVTFITIRGVPATSGSTVLLTADNVSWPLISANDNHDISLTNLTFKSGNGCSGKLVYLYGGGRCGSIQGCLFDTTTYPSNGYSWALYLDNHFRIHVHNNQFIGSGGVYMYGGDSWFYANQMTGPGQQTAPGSMALAMVTNITHSNTITGWYTGIYMVSSDALMVMNNQVSQCVYALRNSGCLDTVGPSGSSGTVLNNIMSNNVYGYTCDRVGYGAILKNNQFLNNNCVYNGPAPANDPYMQWCSAQVLQRLWMAVRTLLRRTSSPPIRGI